MIKPQKIYQLKITIKYTSPPIWRRVLVPGNYTLGDLHAVIQTIFGWTNSHLHDFEIGGERYDDKRFEDSWLETKDEESFRIRDLIKKKGQKFTYMYDFGDSWEHLIVVEKITKPDSKQTYPLCLKGKLRTPEEDCGGVGGHYSLLEIINNPKHEEHEEMISWLCMEEGETWDPNLFDIKAVNKILQRIFKTN